MSKPKGTSALIMVLLLTLLALAFARAEEPNTTESQAKAVKMNALLGRGINLGNALEALYEGAWGVTLKEEYFQIIKDAGFDSIRLPVRWSAYALAEKPYTIKPDFFKRIDWAINCALSRDMLIMINVQQYVELYSDSLSQKDRFIAIWRQIAEHYKDYPDALLFEIFNEPYNTITPEIWNDFVKAIVPVIRESNPNRTIVVDSANNAWASYLQFLKLPENDRNIIVSIHHYFPLEFTHQGAPWMEQKYNANSWLGTKWTGTDEEKKAMTDLFDVAVSWGKKHNRTINLGEFGAYKKADMDSRVRWTKFIADTAAERGMSLMYWEFCADEFGLYDRKAKSWRKELLEAVIPPK